MAILKSGEIHGLNEGWEGIHHLQSYGIHILVLIVFKGPKWTELNVIYAYYTKIIIMIYISCTEPIILGSIDKIISYHTLASVCCIILMGLFSLLLSCINPLIYYLKVNIYLDQKCQVLMNPEHKYATSRTIVAIMQIWHSNFQEFGQIMNGLIPDGKIVLRIKTINTRNIPTSFTLLYGGTFTKLDPISI